MAKAIPALATIKDKSSKPCFLCRKNGENWNAKFEDGQVVLCDKHLLEVMRRNSPQEVPDKERGEP